MNSYVLHFVTGIQKFMINCRVLFSILCKTAAKKKKKGQSYNCCCCCCVSSEFIYCTFWLGQNTKCQTHCTKLITYTIGLLISCVVPSFMSKALSSKPICGPFHNVHVFHRTSSSLCFFSLCSRDSGASSGTENKERLKRLY